MLDEDVAREENAQPGPLGPGGEERGSDARQHVGRHARSRVTDDDLDPVRVLGDLHPDLPLRRSCIDGVRDQVEECLGEPPGIGAHLGIPMALEEHTRGVGASFGRREHVVDDSGQLQRSALERRHRSREGQVLLEDGVDPPDLALDDRQLLTRLRVGGEVEEVTVALLLAWGVVSRAIGSPALPGPAVAIEAFVRLAPELWAHTVISTGRVLAAMLLGTALAVPLGLVLGRSPRADAVAAPLIFLSYPVPKVVFLPVLLVLLGLGNSPKIALIGLIIFFQILVTARDAAKAVPEASVLSVRSLGASRFDIYRHVVVPASLPDIFTALRIGTGTAIAVLFLAESIAGTNGLGYAIVDAWGRIDYPGMFAGIIAMALLGVALYEALNALEWWATRWRRAGR